MFLSFSCWNILFYCWKILADPLMASAGKDRSPRWGVKIRNKERKEKCWAFLNRNRVKSTDLQDIHTAQPSSWSTCNWSRNKFVETVLWLADQTCSWQWYFCLGFLSVPKNKKSGPLWLKFPLWKNLVWIIWYKGGKHRLLSSKIRKVNILHLSIFNSCQFLIIILDNLGPGRLSRL